MTIEFRCSQCNQLLRVPDDAAGKNARCPKCQALMLVPAASSDPQFGSAPSPAASPPASDPFAPQAGGGGFGSPPSSPPPAHPFGEADGASPFGGGQPASINPYASPAAAMASASAFQKLPIVPQVVPAEAIFNYAWEIWKANLGILIGITLTILAVNYAVAIPAQILQMVFQQNNQQEAVVGTAIFSQLLNNLIQIYLGIGQVQINLKLARRLPVNFSELFGGLPLFWPVFASAIVAGIALFFGFALCIVPGVLLLLSYWPFYYLIVDRQVPVMESFQQAAKITPGNWGNAFVLWLMSIGISLLGCAACGIGLIFAMPLVSMMFAVAYLMMSGQLSPYPLQPQPTTYAPIK